MRRLLALACCLVVANLSAEERPNVLLIVSEDNGPELGCYGDPYARTPNLDRLAAEGVRFERAFVTQAGCSQSRASFLTGLYPHQHGQIGLATWGFRMYREDTPNLPRSLKAAGYRTGIIGKLHVNPESAFPFDFHEIPGANFGRRQLADYARHAAGFIGASDRPFFLSVNFPDAHDPWLRQVDGLPRTPLTGADVKAMPYLGVDPKGMREMVADYHNSIARLDACVGELLAALERSGKAANTLVIYLGDHGADFLRGKRTCHEGGLRVPLILRWPGRAAPQVRRELVSTVDLMPTVLEAAAAPPMAGLPGLPLQPLLRPGEPKWRTHLFTEYHSHAAAADYFPQRAVRTDRFKLIENLLPCEIHPDHDRTLAKLSKDSERRGGPDDLRDAIAGATAEVKDAYARMRRPPRYELYDLKADPFEFRDLADRPEHAETLAPKTPHHRPKAKSIIYLFMAGGPSQLEFFDHKPKLNELNGQPIPASFIEGKRFAFMGSSHRVNLLGHDKQFKQHGRSGAWVSDMLPFTAAIADELCFVKTCKTDLFNHAPAKLFMNTGSGLFGRPSMGAWMTYGLGSECADLPGFVVLQSGPRGPRGGASLWSSGMLPSTYQGVPLRGQGDPILNLTNPQGVAAVDQRKVIDAVRELNAARLAKTGDDEISARLNAYEMAYRMQTSAPAVMDLKGESKATLDLYGIKDPAEASFARNCLLARRLVERGVRFIQLYDTNWDHHGGVTENLQKHLPMKAKDIDQACAALVRDLKSRGLLDDTIVVWGGEFGRTPMGEVREFTGRNHHIDAFTMWFAGGGFRPGMTWGETDEFGFGAAKDPVHVRDIHATLLHQMGLNHEKLSVRSQGLDVRLTGVNPAKVLKPLLA